MPAKGLANQGTHMCALPPYNSMPSGCTTLKSTMWTSPRAFPVFVPEKVSEKGKTLRLLPARNERRGEEWGCRLLNGKFVDMVTEARR